MQVRGGPDGAPASKRAKGTYVVRQTSGFALWLGQGAGGPSADGARCRPTELLHAHRRSPHASRTYTADDAPSEAEGGGLSAHYLAEMRKFQSLTGEKTSTGGRPLLK